MTSTDTETVYIENTLWCVFNEDGDLTADMDRDTAIARMRVNFDGGHLRVIEIKVKAPRPAGYLASITLRDDSGEAIVDVA